MKMMEQQLLEASIPAESACSKKSRKMQIEDALRYTMFHHKDN